MRAIESAHARTRSYVHASGAIILRAAASTRAVSQNQTIVHFAHRFRVTHEGDRDSAGIFDGSLGVRPLLVQRAMSLVRKILLFLLVLLAGVVSLGCARDGASDDGISEGALSVNQPSQFSFRVGSAREKAGEVDPVNAFWAIWLSTIAYGINDESQLRDVLGTLGVTPEDIVVFHAEKSSNPLTTRSVTGTDGYYFRTGEAGFLVFRGTDAVDDSIADARVLQVETRFALNRAAKGRVHEGFFFALKAVWPKLRERLKASHQATGIPLYVMGHSLGAGLSTLAMHQLLFDQCLNDTLARADVLGVCERSYVPVAAVYTFGSPRVGNEEFSTMLTQRANETNTRMFRFVNEGDQITMLPRYEPVQNPIIEPYRHFGANGDERAFAVFLGMSGQPAPRPQSRCPSNDRLVQCDLSIDDAVNGLVNGHPVWKGEHARFIYLEKLRAWATGTVPNLELLRRQLQ